MDHASSHLFVLQLLRLLLSVLLHDSHLSHELLFFLLQQFFLAVTVDFVITAVLNLDEVVNALGIVKFTFVDASPLDSLFEPLTHVFELEVRASVGTSILIVWVVIEVYALVVHQVRGRILLLDQVSVRDTYLVSCRQSFSWQP